MGATDIKKKYIDYHWWKMKNDTTDGDYDVTFMGWVYGVVLLLLLAVILWKPLQGVSDFSNPTVPGESYCDAHAC